MKRLEFALTVFFAILIGIGIGGGYGFLIWLIARHGLN